MSRKFPTVAIAITAGILSVLGGLLGNIATSTIPPAILPSLRFSWPALAVVSLLSIGISVWQELKSTTPLPLPTTPPVPATIPLESLACPFCQKNDLQIQGKGKSSLILACKNCGKFLRVVYQEDNTFKMIIPGTIALVGIVAIAEYFHHEPTVLADIFWDLFENL